MGLSLIEVLVVMAVLGILIALLLPAIQASREASRRFQCAAHFHQLGVTLNHHGLRAGTFPSSLRSVLFVIDQAALADALRGITQDRSSRTAASLTNLGIFLCPSDQNVLIHGGTNCAGNGGLGFTARGHAENGAFGAALDSFTDGTSNTTAMSEWVRGHGDPQDRNPKRAVFATGDRLIGPNSVDAFSAQCHSLDAGLAKLEPFGKGMSWLQIGFPNSLYNHVLTPNEKSCTNAGLIEFGAWTVGIHHPSGVNVLFADGHTVFVRDSIAPHLWRALGTRNGGESVSAGSF